MLKYKNYKYIGDPVNAVRIFNELEVDELCLLDIRASKNKYPSQYRTYCKKLQMRHSCHMSYSERYKNIRSRRNQFFQLVFEKIIINTSYGYNRNLVTRNLRLLSDPNQSLFHWICTQIFLTSTKAYVKSGTEQLKDELHLDIVRNIASDGAGEIILNSINRDGTWKGFDVDKIKIVSDFAKIPVIANCGAGKIDHINEVFEHKCLLQ